MSTPNAADVLYEYSNKRSFTATTEPKDDAKTTERLHQKHGRPLFVVQEHAASHHHFDLRLEIAGVLRSWAVPKGPATDPAAKRLAVETEDHPIAYADFEGVIPAGQYGAGTVIVWDIGALKNLKKDTLATQYQQGQIAVWLQGKKLRGGYALRHTGFNDNEQNWLLVKMQDEHADARRNPTSTEPHSVKSGKTIKELREAYQE